VIGALQRPGHIDQTARASKLSGQHAQAIGGHLGGLAAGVICGFAVSRLPDQGQWLALSGVAVASVVGSLLSAGAL
jgi:hypothetical protein